LKKKDKKESLKKTETINFISCKYKYFVESFKELGITGPNGRTLIEEFLRF